MAALTLANSGTPVPFYLKHFTSEGVVTESYVEFVVTSEMATANPGMTAGTYALRGFDTYDEVNDACEAEYWDSTNDICLSPYYSSNVTTLQTVFGVSNCTDGTTWYSCSVSGLYALAHSRGDVRAECPRGSRDAVQPFFSCFVYDDGDSHCG